MPKQVDFPIVIDLDQSRRTALCVSASSNRPPRNPPSAPPLFVEQLTKSASSPPGSYSQSSLNNSVANNFIFASFSILENSYRQLGFVRNTIPHISSASPLVQWPDARTPPFDKYVTWVWSCLATSSNSSRSYTLREAIG